MKRPRSSRRCPECDSVMEKCGTDLYWCRGCDREYLAINLFTDAIVYRAWRPGIGSSVYGEGRGA
jgi:tRNA(Ile2) C34 agmatinyltransferase TiaS